MRTARCEPCRLAVAFGVGVLLSMLFPPKWILIVTLTVLIVLAICELR